MSAARPAPDRGEGSRLFARSPARVRIVEVGPRDGLQNETVPVSTAAKIAFIEALAAAGHSHIEVTSFVSPKKVPQLADAEAVCAGIVRQERVIYTALVPNETGLRRALAAGIPSIALFTAASETFNRKNLGASIAESLATIRSVAAEAARAGLRTRAYVSMAFVCPYEGRIAPETVLDVIDRLRGAGIRNISLGDTLGAAYPDQVSRLLEGVEARHGLAGFALHLHDTHRCGLANALAGLLHGIEEFDSSAGGLGGCPFAPGARGNIATEELVDLFEGMGIETGVSAEKVREAAGRIREALSRQAG